MSASPACPPHLAPHTSPCTQQHTSHPPLLLASLPVIPLFHPSHVSPVLIFLSYPFLLLTDGSCYPCLTSLPRPSLLFISNPFPSSLIYFLLLLPFSPPLSLYLTLILCFPVLLSYPLPIIFSIFLLFYDISPICLTFPSLQPPY